MEQSYLDFLVRWLKRNDLVIQHIPAAVDIWQRRNKTDKQSQTVDIDLPTKSIIGRITIWETGECDMEALSLSSDTSLWRHFDFTSFDEVQGALVNYFHDLAALPDASDEKRITRFGDSRVAIISTEEDISILIQYYLKENQFTTTIINPEKEVEYIVLLKLFAPDAVILKVVASGAEYDVAEICKKIRGYSLFSALPIIVISPNKQTAYEAGATAWFDVVFDLEKIQHQIKRLIV